MQLFHQVDFSSWFVKSGKYDTSHLPITPEATFLHLGNL
jgi:hypothetical protein